MLFGTNASKNKKEFVWFSSSKYVLFFALYHSTLSNVFFSFYQLYRFGLQERFSAFKGSLCICSLTTFIPNAKYTAWIRCWCTIISILKKISTEEKCTQPRALYFNVIQSQYCIIVFALNKIFWFWLHNFATYKYSGQRSFFVKRFFFIGLLYSN